MKQRLVGAVVLVALVVIFVPMLLDDEPMVTASITKSNIPPQPKSDFPTRTFPRKEVKPLPPAASVIEPTKAARSEPEAKPVKSTPKSRTGLSAWVVQVASFEKRANANKLVKRLQAKKLSAFLEQASVDRKTVFRVRVGPEVDHKKAQAIRAQIERQFKLKGKIERYP
ncbi:MAG: SPOR domain-containing protein [Candidatus Polarisedimenticolaceae bacterium]|nr:SPOR domain-containing protein [Candidatus Polarisedimenticolaceae bacterium]